MEHLGRYPRPHAEEVELLQVVERNLEAVVSGDDVDPKVQAVLHHLHEGNWLETNEAIIFSQPDDRRMRRRGPGSGSALTPAISLYGRTLAEPTFGHSAARG
jgi:hypothetical protein